MLNCIFDNSKFNIIRYIAGNSDYKQFAYSRHKNILGNNTRIRTRYNYCVRTLSVFGSFFSDFRRYISVVVLRANIFCIPLFKLFNYRFAVHIYLHTKITNNMTNILYHKQKLFQVDNINKCFHKKQKHAFACFRGGAVIT
jgi:hypothetical protein